MMNSSKISGGWYLNVRPGNEPEDGRLLPRHTRRYPRKQAPLNRNNRLGNAAREANNKVSNVRMAAFATLALLLVVVYSVPLGLPSADVYAGTLQDVGKATKKAAKDTKKAGKKAAKDTQKAGGKAVKDASKAVKKAARDTQRAINKGADDAAKGIKRLCNVGGRLVACKRKTAPDDTSPDDTGESTRGESTQDDANDTTQDDAEDATQDDASDSFQDNAGDGAGEQERERPTWTPPETPDLPAREAPEERLQGGRPWYERGQAPQETEEE